MDGGRPAVPGALLRLRRACAPLRGQAAAAAGHALPNSPFCTPAMNASHSSCVKGGRRVPGTGSSGPRLGYQDARGLPRSCHWRTKRRAVTSPTRFSPSEHSFRAEIHLFTCLTIRRRRSRRCGDSSENRVGMAGCPDAVAGPPGSPHSVAAAAITTAPRTYPHHPPPDQQGRQPPPRLPARHAAGPHRNRRPRPAPASRTSPRTTAPPPDHLVKKLTPDASPVIPGPPTAEPGRAPSRHDEARRSSGTPIPETQRRHQSMRKAHARWPSGPPAHSDHTALAKTAPEPQVSANLDAQVIRT